MSSRFLPPKSSLCLRSTRGFTLVEMGMVTLIIGLLAATGIPAMQRTLVTTKASAVVTDLRTFAGTFQAYAQQTGGYPPEAGVGVMPPLMADALRETSWLRTTPIGGKYDWEFDRTSAGVRYRAAIALRTLGLDNVSMSNSVLLTIDRVIDDGDLLTGNFFIGTGNEPFYVIER